VPVWQHLRQPHVRNRLRAAAADGIQLVKNLMGVNMTSQPSSWPGRRPPPNALTATGT